MKVIVTSLQRVTGPGPVVKCIILVFLGVLTIGIQNSFILQVGYEPHLSDKARCSETSQFLITQIWYDQLKAVLGK